MIKKQEKTDNKRLNSTVIIAVGILMYIMLAMTNLVSSQWTASIEYEIYGEFANTQVSNSSHYLGTDLYFESLKTPELGENLVLFWEGPENNVRKYSFDIQEDSFGNITSSYYTSNNISQFIFAQLANDEFFEVYGKSVLGLYNLEPSGNENQPQLEWKIDDMGYDTKLVKIVPDIDEDGYPDVFVSFGSIPADLPDIEGQGTYIDYFQENWDEFQYYYSIVLIEAREYRGEMIYQSIALLPNYESYKNILISGKSGNEILDQDQKEISFGNSSVIEAILTTNDNEVGDALWDFKDEATELVLLKSTLDRSIYLQNDFYFERSIGEDTLSWTDTIQGYFLKNGTQGWTLENLSSANLTYQYNIDYLEDPYENFLPITNQFFTEANGIITPKPQVTISLESQGFHRLQSMGNGFIIEFYPATYFYRPISQSHAFSNNGTNLWNKKGTYFTGYNDYNGNGFYDVGQLDLDFKSNYVDNYDQINLTSFKNPRVHLINPETGNTIALYELDISSEMNYFSFSRDSIPRLSKFGIGFVDDDSNYDGFAEFIGLTAYSNPENVEEILYRSFKLELSFDMGNLYFSQPYGFWGSVEEANHIKTFRQQLEMKSIDADLDKDGIFDYIVGRSDVENTLVLVTSNIAQLPDTYQLSRFEGAEHSPSPSIDWRPLDQRAIILEDFSDKERVIGIFNGNRNVLVLYDDIQVAEIQGSFTDFFSSFSLSLTLGAVILALVCILVIGIGLKKKKDKPIPISEEHQKNISNLTILMRISLIIVLISLVAIIIYLRSVVNFQVQYSYTYVGPQANILAFIVVYPMVFPLMLILPIIYRKVAPYFAEKTYVNFQNRILKPRMKKKIIEYQVIVTQMDTRDKVALSVFIKRALLPVLISFTIGISIYQGLADDGWIVGIIRVFNSDFVAPTKPDQLGIIQENVPFDRIWVEMGAFASYCVLPMIITFFITSGIIPSSWVLDDSGVSYYVKHVGERGINDVESISTWLLSIISGFFGMSAILSYINLFTPFTAQTSQLANEIELNLANANGSIGVLIFILTLIVFPLMMSFSIMVACIERTETDFIPLADELLERLEKKNIDTTPCEIASVLEANVGTTPWTEDYKEDFQIYKQSLWQYLLHKKELDSEQQSEDLEKVVQILQTIEFIPQLLEQGQIQDSINIIRAKLTEAHEGNLVSAIGELSHRIEILKGIVGYSEILQRETKISIKELSKSFSFKINDLENQLKVLVTESPNLKIEKNKLIVFSTMGELNPEKDRELLLSVVGILAKGIYLNEISKQT